MAPNRSFHRDDTEPELSTRSANTPRRAPVSRRARLSRLADAVAGAPLPEPLRFRIGGLILRIAGKSARHLPPPDDGKVRINLGSGDKNLEGYVNVDIVDARSGIRPDVVCDIRKLEFPDAYAAEILSIHTIEHFYYWEVDEVLREWKRVLKPGGKLILECPNIVYAARRIVGNERRLLSPRLGWRSTMFVLYGDPAWEDPFMCHRWGWSPLSLRKKLEEIGFRKVGRDLARFKKSYPRDMRIIGIKPNR